MAQDLYAQLGVSKTAEADAIKKAYRKLARDLHPDKNPGNAKAEAEFKKVNHAFEVLSNPEKRALYDEFGEDALRDGFDAERARQMRSWGRRGGGMPGGGGGVPLEDLFGNFGGGGGGDPFSDLFGGGRRRGPVRGRDLEMETTLSFGDAARGTTLDIAPQGQTMTVRIPPGAEDGTRLRLTGRGMASPQGGPPGDLHLIVRVKAHPHYRRENDDLHVDLPITLSEAYFGTKARVPTLDGGVMVKVPERSQSGATLRLRGKGIARKGQPAGDLYVHLMVRVPNEDSAEVRELIEKLKAHEGGDPRADISL